LQLKSNSLITLEEDAFLTQSAIQEETLHENDRTFLDGGGQKYLDLILSALEDAKAEDIVSIDLRGRSALADCMVIGSGRSQRHVMAVADQLIGKLRDVGVRNIRVEGLEAGDWVLLDTGDVIIHLFKPEIREFYNLEKMWQPTIYSERM